MQLWVASTGLSPNNNRIGHVQATTTAALVIPIFMTAIRTSCRAPLVKPRITVPLIWTGQRVGNHSNPARTPEMLKLDPLSGKDLERGKQEPVGKNLQGITKDSLQ